MRFYKKREIVYRREIIFIFFVSLHSLCYKNNNYILIKKQFNKNILANG